MEALFFGSYEHQIDDKGRFRIPAKFKKGLETYPEKTYSFVRGLPAVSAFSPTACLKNRSLLLRKNAFPKRVPFR